LFDAIIKPSIKIQTRLRHRKENLQLCRPTTSFHVYTSAGIARFNCQACSLRKSKCSSTSVARLEKGKTQTAKRPEPKLQNAQSLHRLENFTLCVCQQQRGPNLTSGWVTGRKDKNNPRADPSLYLRPVLTAFASLTEARSPLEAIRCAHRAQNGPSPLSEHPLIRFCAPKYTQRQECARISNDQPTPWRIHLSTQGNRAKHTDAPAQNSAEHPW